LQIALLKKETLGSQIAVYLRKAILTGELAPGAPVTENVLAARFGVSRGPLREAMRQLIDEGLMVTVPYTGTRVLQLTVSDINDIYAMRTCLEDFAFRLVWGQRDDAFRAELQARHALLQEMIDAGDDFRSIESELDLHGLVYERAGNRLLEQTWKGIRGRLQLYWAAHHRAHGMRGPRRESHDDYVRLALGNDLHEMVEEIGRHMRLGLERTKSFVEQPASANAST
jgi:DNA-binding GntR family transcriptional regulator